MTRLDRIIKAFNDYDKLAQNCTDKHALNNLQLEVSLLIGELKRYGCRRNEKAKHARWIYWEGWVGNSAQRIDDATCSECGYKHPTVYWKKGEQYDSTPNKLASICPNCKSIMNKW